MDIVSVGVMPLWYIIIIMCPHCYYDILSAKELNLCTLGVIIAGARTCATIHTA